jgi:hypothetical protein
MKQVLAIAACLLFVGQTTLAVAATDDAAASNAPTAQVRAVSQCNLQQRKLAKADQTRVHAANRCQAEGGGLFGLTTTELIVGGLVVVGLGVGIYEGTKSTSP